MHRRLVLALLALLRCLTSPRPRAALHQVYSWMLGAEVNDPFYARFPAAFADWGFAPAVALWPSPFDASFQPSMLAHFAEYVRGAHGLNATGEGDGE